MIKSVGDWLSEIGYACYGYINHAGKTGFVRWNGQGFWDDGVEKIEFDSVCISTKLPCYKNFEVAFGIWNTKQ